MNFDEFIARVVDEMRSRLLRQGDGSDIRVNKVLKNNGVELTAMNVCKSSEGVCPTIYLDPFYRDYEQGMDFDVVMEDICSLREPNCRCRKLDIRDVVDETKVMDNIILRLVNRERNSRLLESAPFIEFNDLAITFRRVLSLDNDGLATTIVNNNDVKRWRVSLDTLYKNALKNTQRMFPCVRQNLFDALKGRYEGIDFDDDCDNVTNCTCCQTRTVSMGPRPYCMMECLRSVRIWWVMTYISCHPVCMSCCLSGQVRITQRIITRIS